MTSRNVSGGPLYMVAGDTLPDLMVQVTDSASLLAWSGSETVELLLADANDPNDTYAAGAGTGSVYDVDGLILRYQWDAADTATAGAYKYRFRVTAVGGDVQTFPAAGHGLVILSSATS